MKFIDESTTQEWERLVGAEIRATRVTRNLTQRSVASLANISILTLSNLEQGKGSSLATLVGVVRALGREDWLTALAPPITISPLHMLRSKERSPRSRVRSESPPPPSSLVAYQPVNVVEVRCWGEEGRCSRARILVRATTSLSTTSRGGAVGSSWRPPRCP